MLTIQTFNALHIAFNQQPIAKFKNKKAQALLVFLAIHAGQAFERKYLQSLLWSDSGEVQAGNSLRQTLSLMRRVLPEHIVIQNRRTVAFNQSADYTLDVDQLSSDPTVYTGRFLEGFDLKNADRWDEWLQIYREQIEVRAIEAFEQAAERAQRNRHWDEAIRLLQRVLTIDSWRESTHRQLMQLFLQIGDRTAALAQFETCQAILDEALGVEPSDETIQLYEQIAKGEAQRTHNLPPVDSLTQFIGRSADITRLTHLLTSNHLVTLVGLGGIGKTRLAIETARRLLHHFVHGVWFVDLVGVDHAGNVAMAVADVVGLTLSDVVPTLQQLSDHFAERSCLLILDNYEHLLPNCEVIQTLLKTSAATRLLVTSRQRLNLRNEQVLQLHGLLLTDAAEQFAHSECARLFVNHAQRVNYQFELSADNRDIVQRICRLLDGMPLGLELAASWVRLIDVDAIAAEIEQSIAFLQSTQRDVPERQRSLKAVFDYTWQLLSPQERAVMQQLAFFRGGFGREAFHSVTNASLFTLLNLHDKTLIQTQPNNRYRLHEQLRQYILAALSAEQRATLGRSWALHFLQYLDDHRVAIGSASAPEVQQHLREDSDNFMAAYDWAIESAEMALIERATPSIHLMNLLRGRGPQSIELFQRVRLLFEHTPHYQSVHQSLYATVLSALGVNYHRLGNNDAARPLLELAIAQHKQASSIERQLASMVDLGECLRDMGRYQMARNTLVETIALARLHVTSAELARFVNSLGVVEKLLGNFDAAYVAYREAHDLIKASGHKRGTAYTLNNLAILEFDYGDATAAPRQLNEAVALLREVEDLRMLAMSLSNRGLHRAYFQQFDASAADLEEARRLAEYGQFKWVLALVWNATGYLNRQLGDTTASRRAYQQSMQLYQSVGDSGYVALCQHDLGWLDYLDNDLASAERLIVQSFHTASTQPPLVIDIVGGIGCVWVAMGKQIEQAKMLLRYTLLHAKTSLINRETIQDEVERLGVDMHSAEPTLDDKSAAEIVVIVSTWLIS